VEESVSREGQGASLGIPAQPPPSQPAPRAQAHQAHPVVEHDVPRFDITVDHVLAVHVGEATRHANAKGEDLHRGHGLALCPAAAASKEEGGREPGGSVQQDA